MKFPKVGVIILTYNSENYIDGCIKSIFGNIYKDYICIVVDNNSTDKTLNIVKKKCPKIKIIKNKTNLGYGAGNNIGIRYLLKNKNISYILILNPDTLVSPTLITESIRVLIHGNSIGVVGPIITYAHDPKKIWFAGGYLNRLFMYTKHLNMNKNIDSLYDAPFVIARSSSMKNDEAISVRKRLPRSPDKNEIARNDTVKTDFITGACMMIKTEVFMNVGLLPEDYFMYFEDVDFCQQAIKAGYSCKLIAKPLVKHYVSASSGNIGTNDLTPTRAYYYARNPFIYIKKNVEGFYKITNYAGQFLIRLPYYGLQMLIKGDLKGIIAYLKGLVDGIKYKL